MRRLIIEEPYSRPAKWSPKLAWFALVVTILVVMLIRFGRIDYQSGFIALGAGIGIALLAVCLSFIGIRPHLAGGAAGAGKRDQGAARCRAGAGLSGIHGSQSRRPCRRSPMSAPTRTIRLPSPAPGPRSRRATAVFRRKSRRRRARCSGLPMFRSRRSPWISARRRLSPSCRRQPQNLGWQVIEATPPGGRVGLGRLEAVDRSLLLKMPTTSRSGSARASTARASTSARPRASVTTIWG